MYGDDVDGNFCDYKIDMVDDSNKHEPINNDGNDNSDYDDYCPEYMMIFYRYCLVCLCSS